MNFYENFISFEFDKTSGQQLYAKCPFHHDVNASFTVNTESDAWFCHGCGEGGHHVEFIMKYYDVSRAIAVKACHQFDQHGTWLFPTEKYVEDCYNALQRRPAALDELYSFGFTDAIIAKYQIGWDDIRVTFPIRSRTGALINIRKYLPPSKRMDGSNNAKMVGIKNLNECRLFPYSVLNEAHMDEPIFIVEGEKDCLALLSQGIWAMTGTGGTVLPVDELDLFANRTVVVMTDSDGPGRRNEQAYLARLRKITSKLFVVHLPEKDFVEFWMKYKTTDFSAWMFADTTPEDRADEDLEVQTVTLTQSEHTSNINRWCRLCNMCITGADPKTYVVPTRLRLVCGNRSCSKPCSIAAGSKPEEVTVEIRQLARFVDAPDGAQDALVQRIFGCKYITTEVVEQINIQKILFQESAAFVEGLEDATFDHRYGLYMYTDSRLLPTVKYDFEACRIADPRSQQNYYIIRSAMTPKASIEGLALSTTTIQFFRAVANRHDNDIWAILNEHYDMWRPRLGIEGRVDLFGALLLTYLSITEVRWRSGTIKGWLDTMIIGDTRTGKSQMAQRLITALNMGSYINGENAKRTGVIGGVQRFGDSWVITWGAIPLNDRGLLLIDEASGLSVEDIKELSATRSSGAVTINKIAKGEARARTRLIWMSNPRSGKNIDEFYWKGFGAFQEFIPVAEDQARFDVVIAAARDDVDVTFEDGCVEPENMDDVVGWMVDLISFAWTIPAENVILSEDAVAEVKVVAKSFDQDLGGGPLIVGAAVHEKIIRIACACAVLKGNINNGILDVTKNEVLNAAQFLKDTLTKPTLDYAGYMNELRRVIRDREENIGFIRVQIAAYPALKVLLASDQFRGQQLYDVLGIDRLETTKLLSELLRRGLVRLKSSGAYAPDKLLIEITKQIGG